MFMYSKITIRYKLRQFLKKPFECIEDDFFKEEIKQRVY